jgi:Zn-dependent protease with chaperone function
MRSCLKLYFAVLCVLICVVSFAQQTATFTPFTTDSNLEKGLLESISNRYQQDVANLTGANRKYLADIYKERFELIKDRFTEKEVLSDKAAQSYLDALVQEVLKGNPSLNAAGLRIVFSRSFYANASSMGEGTILFNIGLFHRLENESQAAFVLCHELAHYFLDHSNQNIRQYVNTVYSDEFQKKLKEIQKSAYQQNSQLEALGRNLLFKSRRHNRQFEQAADSLAVELLKNTRFDVRGALSCLALLDSADKDKYKDSLQLEQQLNFPSFAFKKSWLERDDLVFGTSRKEKEEQEEDSLKTHPDCSKRIEALKEKVAKYAQPHMRPFVVDEQRFRELKQQFDFEIIAYCFQSKRVTRSLYYALQELKVYPQDVYLTTMVGKCLNELYGHQKKHELGKVADLPNPHFDEEYNSLLRMIQNLRLQELAALSYYFLKEKEIIFGHDPDFNKTFTISREQYQTPSMHRF